LNNKVENGGHFPLSKLAFQATKEVMQGRCCDCLETKRDFDYVANFSLASSEFDIFSPFLDILDDINEKVW